jgi:Ser/Thr protein kinase RdoA (MazF antagonist)
LTVQLVQPACATQAFWNAVFSFSRGFRRLFLHLYSKSVWKDASSNTSNELAVLLLENRTGHVQCIAPVLSVSGRMIHHSNGPNDGTQKKTIREQNRYNDA